MPIKNYSLRLPGITDTPIVNPVEILAFASLPYYQVSGNLLAGEGELTFGDPVAWDSTAEKFIAFDADGGGDGATCVGFCRIPADARTVDAPIEVIVGGAVKYSVVSAATEWDSSIITDLKARYVVAADALIF